MTRTRCRLDQAMVERGVVDTRSRARRFILAGLVAVDGQRVDKPGTAVKETSDIVVQQRPRFVSRGGDKLAAALEVSGLDVRGRICLDVGASTGGFTDCLLQWGASRVVAVDVGYGQLDWKLRQDDRVDVVERVNARGLTLAHLPDGLPGPPDVLVMDVSFIGIDKILPAVSTVLAPTADAVLLVKPQFECGPGAVERGGVVRSAADRRGALLAVASAAAEVGWETVAAIPSPLRGPSGNWECFLQEHRPPRGRAVPGIENILADVEVPDDGIDTAPPAPRLPSRPAAIRGDDEDPSESPKQ